MHRPIVEPPPRRINLYRENKRKSVDKIDWEVVNGWICCAIITISSFYLIGQIVRFAIRNQRTVLAAVGL